MKGNLIIFTLIICHITSGKITAQETKIASARNSITIMTPKEAKTNEAEVNSSNSLTQIQYFDGLGRPAIQVAKGVTPSGADLVSMSGLGFHNRKIIQLDFLPFPATINGIPDPNALVSTSRNYYNQEFPHYSTENLTYELFPTVYKIKPGKSPYVNSAVKTSTVLHSNIDAEGSNAYKLDVVRRYIASGYGAKYVGDYGNKQLEYTHTQDENGKELLKYYDRYGKLILSRRIESGTKVNGKYTSFVGNETYYVYDDMDRLHCVISPEGAARMNELNRTYSYSGGPNGENIPIDQYCYLYRYDGFNRCIAKKLPGTDWIHYVYDKAGRMVLSQDGNQSYKSEWTFYKYNRHGQLIQQGKTYFLYNNHDWLMNTYKQQVVVEEWVDGSGYTNNHPLGTGTVTLAQNFYNDYKFKDTPLCTNLKNRVYSTVGEPRYETPYKRLYENMDISTQGILTGTSVKMLDENFNKISFLRYDRFGRLIMNRSNNHLDGWDQYAYSYNFMGQTDKQKHQQRVHSSDATKIATYPEEYTYTYDHAGRLSKITHQLSTLPVVDIQSFEYDELGRVKTKGLHGSSWGGLEYKYNMLGQATRIISPGDQYSFQQDIYYRADGNITQIDEMVESSSSEYHLYYDKLNRLTKTWLMSSQSQLCNLYEYDKNGNITNLQRQAYGYIYQAGRHDKATVDLLDITYSGNRMKKIVDSGLAMDMEGIHFEDRNTAPVPEEYTYDANGNVTGDYNKNIAWIKYNLLNLPAKIQFGNGNKTEYLYDASGTKRKAIYSTSQNTMQIPLGSQTENTNSILRLDEVDYVDNIEYRNDIPQRMHISGGYIDMNGTDIREWKYVYYIRDYRGDIRMEAVGGGTVNTPVKGIVERRKFTKYYPFGQSFNPQLNRQHSGNEFEKSNGLYQHDFNFRWYDQLVGRFISIDPLAEKYYGISPYAYCANNPINYIDPNGLDFYLLGDYKEETLEQVQSRVGSSITLNINSDGKVTYKMNGKKVRGSDAKRIVKIIDDHDVTVNIFTTKKVVIDNTLLSAGSFMGNTIGEDQDGNCYAVAEQWVNTSMLAKIDNFTYTPGKMLMHEITEAYEGARISMATGFAASPGYKNLPEDDPTNIFLQAHQKATPQTPIKRDYYDKKNKLITNEKNFGTATRVDEYVENSWGEKFIFFRLILGE